MAVDGPTVSGAAIKALATRAALARGAADVRIVAASPDAVSRERMHAAFARGDFETWGYDGAYAAASVDPTHVLAGARSVICIGIPYATPPPKRAPLHGRVS